MDKTLRVFIPHELPVRDEDGHLVGWSQTCSQKNNQQLTTVFVFALIPHEQPLPVACDTRNSAQIRILGTFEHDERVGRAPLRCSSSGNDVQLTVRLTITHQLDVTGVRVGDILLESPSKCCDLILYDPCLFTRLNPEIISPAGSGTDHRSTLLIQTLSTALRDFRGSPLSEAAGIVDFAAVSSSSSMTSAILVVASNLCLKCVAVGAGLFYKGLCTSGVTSLVDKTSKFSVCSQLKTRFLQLDYLSKTASNPGGEMRFWNTSAAIFADFLLGLILTAVLYKSVSTVILLDVFLDWTNLLVDNLRSLLIWLMGNPAGFKLNHRLSSSMGTFFTYHIYLWEAYLHIIKPALELMLAIVFYCGVLGLTFQLGMLNDLFTFATFHVYCFYAYAAKLYNLNFVGLISYWRLFRGKKWNPLRQRVDSCTYDVDQLFMGTLCFTTLLFLLPTTLLYYAVFTILRIPIILLQGIIHKTMGFINQLPLYTMILYIIGSKCLIGRINFTVVPGHTFDGPLILTMKGERCSCDVALLTFLPPVSQRGEKVTGWTLLKNLSIGKLIYPI